MAISAQCPHCKKTYKFKDEYQGKRVKCAVTDCRQVFDVIVMDAEALALAALGEHQETVVDATEARKVKVTCVACEHVWEEAWDKQGKNILCPECRHRQKVPEQKGAGAKIDWRDSQGGRPSLAKREDVPEDVWGSSKSNVSVETLKKAGAIPEPEVEPRPLSFWIKTGGAGLFALILVGGGLFFAFRGGDAGAQEKLMKEAMGGLAGLKDSGLSPATAAVAEGVLRTAEGEFRTRAKKTEKLQTAYDLFSRAHLDLDNAPKGIERDGALADWLMAITALGGDAEQVKAGARFGWEPAGGPAKAQVNLKIHLVVEELQSGLTSLQKGSEFDTRISIYRRLTTTLAEHKQTKLLPALLGNGFSGDEVLEAQGYLGLDLLRLGDDPTARVIAGQLDAAFPGDGAKQKAPGSVRALWHVTQTKALPTIGEGNPELKTRLALALVKAMEKDGEGAAREALRPGPVAEQFKVLALCAESMDDPAAVVSGAMNLYSTVQKNQEEFGRVGTAGWARLARAAARTGNDDEAKGFATAPLSDEARAYAVSEMTRGKLAALGTQKVDLAWLDVPGDPKKLKVGHLIAQMMIARHNGRVTGDASQAKALEAWPKETSRPFGLAGLALGLQDKSQ